MEFCALFLTACLFTPPILTVAQIESHRQEIEALKVQLQEERTRRRHKEEYEALARIINSFPARHVTEARIDGLTAEMDTLSREKAGLDADTAARSRQFAAFFAALEQLRGVDAVALPSPVEVVAPAVVAGTTVGSNAVPLPVDAMDM